MHLSFLFPSTNGTVILHSLVNLSFVKYIQKNYLIMSSNASSHLVPGPLRPKGWVKGGHRCSSIQCSEGYSPLGLEKMTLRSKGSRSPDGRKGRKLGSSCVAVAWAVTSSLAAILLERKAVLGRQGWLGTASLAPCLTGQSI